jgi:hypothetical protein
MKLNTKVEDPVCQKELSEIAVGVLKFENLSSGEGEFERGIVGVHNNESGDITKEMTNISSVVDKNEMNVETESQISIFFESQNQSEIKEKIESEIKKENDNDMSVKSKINQQNEQKSSHNSKIQKRKRDSLKLSSNNKNFEGQTQTEMTATDHTSLSPPQIPQDKKRKINRNKSNKYVFGVV